MKALTTLKILPLLLASSTTFASASDKHAPPHKDATATTKDSAEKLSDRVTCEKLPQKSEADLWNLAECFFKLGMNSTTIETLRSISQRNPRALDAYFTASWLLWQEGRTLGGADERKRTQEALDELLKARVSNPTHWEVDTEIGDFYYLRTDEPDKAYVEYINARRHYEGDFARNVPKAENGRKAAIEDRIARTCERLDRKGEAVEATCRALYFDPDDHAAEERLNRLNGSCSRKNVKDPRQEKLDPEH